MGRRIPERERCCMDALACMLPVALEGRDFRGDLDIRVDGGGDWHYNHSPIKRHAMVCLFASMLVRDDQGQYWLVTPTELGRIQVEDAPLLVVNLYTSGAGEKQTLNLCTNVDQLITVSAATPLVMKPSPINGEMAPYVTDAQSIEAKITRAAYYSLVELATVQNGELGVWSDGVFFPLGAAFDPDA